MQMYCTVALKYRYRLFGFWLVIFRLCRYSTLLNRLVVIHLWIRLEKSLFPSWSLVTALWEHSHCPLQLQQRTVSWSARPAPVTPQILLPASFYLHWHLQLIMKQNYLAPWQRQPQTLLVAASWQDLKSLYCPMMVKAIFRKDAMVVLIMFSPLKLHD